MRAAITIIYIYGVYISPALAQPLTCSTWQQINTCQGPGGYVSHELHWQDQTIRDDNRGDRWTTSRWQGFAITTVDRPPGWDGR